MLLRLGRLSICLSLCLLGISPVVLLQYLLEALEKKRNKRATPTPADTPKLLFEFDDESIFLPKGRGVYFEDPNFECALKGQENIAASRRSGRSWRAAPVFQSSPR